MMINLLNDLKGLKFNYKLGKKTWFGTGGNSMFFIEINSESNLQKLLKFIPYSIPIFVLGAGSNIIIRDGGFNGLTIKLNGQLKKINYDKHKKILEIGGAVKDLIITKFCENNSITGFEFLRGIPGTLGGNIKMNAGCYGKTISDNLISCKIIDRCGKIKSLQKEDIKIFIQKHQLKKIQLSPAQLSRSSYQIKIKFLKKLKLQMQEFYRNQLIPELVEVHLRIHRINLLGN